MTSWQLCSGQTDNVFEGVINGGFDLQGSFTSDELVNNSLPLVNDQCRSKPIMIKHSFVDFNNVSVFDLSHNV